MTRFPSNWRVVIVTRGDIRGALTVMRYPLDHSLHDLLTAHEVLRSILGMRWTFPLGGDKNAT